MTSVAEELERLFAWDDALEDANYYELLGVLELADAAAIKAAFHEFALAFHPDVHEGADEDIQETARRVFRRGAEAYRVLSDPELRAKYDLVLARGHVRLVEDDPAAGPRRDTSLQSLEDVCRSPAAKLSARKADEHIGRGDLRGARRLLQEALAQDDYDNAQLDERIEALDVALFAMGG